VPSKEVEDEPGGQGGCSVVALAETTFLAPPEEVEDEPIDYFKCVQHAGWSPVTHHTTLSHRDWVTIDYKHTSQSIHSTPGRSAETYPTTLSHRD
jgi:hypothetical protein